MNSGIIEFMNPCSAFQPHGKIFLRNEISMDNIARELFEGVRHQLPEGLAVFLVIALLIPEFQS
jgi:hypothetical protein